MFYQMARCLLALTLAAALLAGCSGAGKSPGNAAGSGNDAGDSGSGPATPGAPAGGAAAGTPAQGQGPVQLRPYAQGGWQLDISNKNFYYDWLPGGRLLVQAGVGSGGVAEVDPARGAAKAWPVAQAHMLLTVSGDGSQAAWPVQEGSSYKVMVGPAGGPGQRVGSGDDDVYQICWLGESALLVERPSGVEYVPLAAGGRPATFAGRRILQSNGGAALLSDPRFPGPGLLVQASGATRPLPSGTLFAALSPDGNRMAWTPSLPPPATATSWLEPKAVLAHGTAAPYARELHLVDLASGKESALALPGPAFVDNIAWQIAGGDLALATHTTTDASGVPKGGGLLRISPEGRINRLDPGSDYFELGGFVGGKLVIFVGDAKDFTKLHPVTLDAGGGRSTLTQQTVQFIDDPLGPPFLAISTAAEITLVNRQDGRRVVLPRRDLPRGTEIYPPEWSPDGRWLLLRGQARVFLLPASAYAAPPL